MTQEQNGNAIQREDKNIELIMENISLKIDEESYEVKNINYYNPFREGTSFVE